MPIARNNANVLFVMVMYFVPSIVSRVIQSGSSLKDLSTITPLEEKDTSEFCWKTENFSAISECIPCTNLDMEQLAICKDTGNKELVECEKSKKKTYVSCPIAVSFEKKRFWTFEAVSLAGALISNAVVWWRRRLLNHLHHQRVKRQMSSATV